MDNGNAPVRRLTFGERSAKRAREVYEEEDDLNLQGHSAGPIYPVDENSFVLQSVHEPVEPNWHARDNPNGIVPVVVSPQLMNGKNGEPQLPLSDDQKEGLKFLWDCWVQGEGGILAHDMGLGKTRTAITLIGTLLQQSSQSCGKSQPALTKCMIIAPKNAVSVWEDEFQKWMLLDIHCEIQLIRSGQRNGWNIVNSFLSDTTNILILSYDSFQKYNSTFEDGFMKYLPAAVGLVFCDEAHVLKNEDTARVKNFRRFVGANFWVGITGTPYQNDIKQFCNLVRFFRRDGPLDDPIYRKSIVEIISKELDKNKKLVTPLAKSKLSELRNIIRKSIHYRANSLNKEKHEVTICIPLDGHPQYYDEQQQADSLQHRIYKELVECLKEFDIVSFPKYSYFQKACIHPKFVKEAIVKKPNPCFGPLLSLYDTTWPPEELLEPSAKLNFPDYSAKIRVVAKMARFLKRQMPDEKMVIVFASKLLLDMVKEYFRDKHKLNLVVYDGDTSQVDRVRSISNFETDDSIQFMLLSLNAGGTALTLTRANHLVLMDPDYNPANDRQALARIYRPGQERPVFIYRLLATGTLEEQKYILQLGKEDMANFFRSPDRQENVQSLYNRDSLLEYHCNTRSYIAELIDKLEVDSFNLNVENVYEMDSTFAEELKSSAKYREIIEVPEKLALVREIWKYASYAFHVAKTTDPFETEFFSIEFENVDSD